MINVHVYALKPRKKGQSPWDRSYPEDPGIEYLKEVDAALAFRDQKAPGKEVWITEFGYDACTPDVMSQRKGWAKKLDWKGVTDQQQAQYLVRSLLCFAQRDVRRAYIYFFNDKNEPSVHASSGLTRDFKPKPSFWAVKHLYETLGDYRFKRVVVKQVGDLYVDEYQHGQRADRMIWVAWSPTGSDREKVVRFHNLPGKLVGAERMPLAAGPAGKVVPVRHGTDDFELKVTESPVYLEFAVSMK